MRNKHHISPILLLLPLFLLTGLLIASILVVLVQSFGLIPAFNLNEWTLQYYREVLQDPRFLESLTLSLRIAVISSLIAVVLGIILCAALVKNNKARSFSLLLIRFPILVPHSIVALFFIILFSQSGLLARLLYALGWIQEIQDFPELLYNTSYTGAIAAYCWKEIPFVAYFCFSLMDSIDKSLSEAAENLGASPLKAFLTVSLPLSFPAIAKAFFIILTFSFSAYELPFLLGVSLPKSLPVQAHLRYYSPELLDKPYAMASFSIILFISLLLGLLLYFLLKRLGRPGNSLAKVAEEGGYNAQ